MVARMGRNQGNGQTWEKAHMSPKEKGLQVWRAFPCNPFLGLIRPQPFRGLEGMQTCGKP